MENSSKNGATARVRRRGNTSIEETLTLRDILDTFVGNWFWFLLSVIICLAAARLYLATKSNVYQRQAVMLVKDDSGQGGGRRSAISTDALMQLNGVLAGASVKNEVYILHSFQLAQEVAKKLQLDVMYSIRVGLRNISLYNDRPFTINFVTEFIALNDDVAGLDDINVRTAIQMSLDKAAVTENIYSGLRTPADSVMPEDMPFCKCDAKTPDYDFDGAVKLLEDSGWKDTNGDGIRDKDGTELSYTITYPATGVYDDVVLYYQQTLQELGIEVKTDPLDLMTFFDKIFSQVDYEMTAYISYWFPYDPYTFVANMYPSTDYTAADGIYSTDPQVSKAMATMTDDEGKELIKGLYTYDENDKIQEIYTKALDSANESSVVIPLNYRNEYAVYNSDLIADYTFNSIPNHVDVAAIKLK